MCSGGTYSTVSWCDEVDSVEFKTQPLDRCPSSADAGSLGNTPRETLLYLS